MTILSFKNKPNRRKKFFFKKKSFFRSNMPCGAQPRPFLVASVAKPALPGQGWISLTRKLMRKRILECWSAQSAEPRSLGLQSPHSGRPRIEPLLEEHSLSQPLIWLHTTLGCLVWPARSLSMQPARIRTLTRNKEATLADTHSSPHNGPQVPSPQPLGCPAQPTLTAPSHQLLAHNAHSQPSFSQPTIQPLARSPKVPFIVGSLPQQSQGVPNGPGAVWSRSVHSDVPLGGWATASPPIGLVGVPVPTRHALRANAACPTAWASCGPKLPVPAICAPKHGLMAGDQPHLRAMPPPIEPAWLGKQKGRDACL
ncbi:Uncharacterized protein TCM_028057 [Theobroma cacao]|uniref:Uncharacterized protein n=1 Tax=Theobroma cacao TaxID=3641 RepID=A0A061GHA7_THECC|nr:Uncharacterized protein TCM_028057 [Theobroma cacao]